MKKLILSFACFAVPIVQSGAQTILISENFNSYNGKDSTVPTGWIFSSHGVYTSASFSGPSGPNSFQFGKDSVALTTPLFSNADSLSFWIKATSTASHLNRLFVLASEKNGTWDTIADMDSLPKSGKTVALSLKNNYTRVCILFRKTSGNLAFDDAIIKSSSPLYIFSSNKKESIHFVFENSVLQINSSHPEAITDAWLFNSNGNMIFRRQMRGSWEIDLSTLQSGLYVAGARLNGKNYSKKIVITK